MDSLNLYTATRIVVAIASALLVANVRAVGGSGSGLGSGNFNGTCGAIFEENDDCDFYVANFLVTCSELENLNVDCSGCNCITATPTKPAANTTLKDPVTTIPEDSVTTPPIKPATNGEKTTATTIATATTATTPKDLVTTPPAAPVTTLPTKPATNTLGSKATEISESVMQVVESGELLGYMQQLPALQLATDIKVVKNQVTQEQINEGNGVAEVQDIVAVSCSITGYTKQTFGPPQQQAFTALIAQQAGVSGERVLIASIKQIRRRRLRIATLRHGARKLAGDTLLVDFLIRVPVSSAEIDDQESGGSDKTNTITLPLAAIIGIVAVAVGVTLATVAAVLFMVVLPRVREHVEANALDTETVSYPSSSTLGSPKGIELRAVTRKVSTGRFDLREDKRVQHPKTPTAAIMVADVVDEVLETHAQEDLATGDPAPVTDTAGSNLENEQLVHRVVQQVLDEEEVASPPPTAARSASEAEASKEADLAASAVVAKVFDTKHSALEDAEGEFIRYVTYGGAVHKIPSVRRISVAQSPQAQSFAKNEENAEARTADAVIGVKSKISARKLSARKLGSLSPKVSIVICADEAELAKPPLDDDTVEDEDMYA